MTCRARWDVALLAIAVAVTRLACRSRYLYDLDSVNFALALRRFDPATHQPHPPGYFLYVMLGRLAQRVFPDANTALVAIGILASCGAVAGIYALAHQWFGRRAAVLAGLLFLFSPLAWFHGTVALTYIFECLFSAAVGYLCWQAWSGRTGWIVPAATVLAVAAGFRQSSLLFLGPLWALAAWKAGRRPALAATGALGLTLAAWVVPMGRASGGLGAYFVSLYDLWSRVPGQRTVLASTLAMGLALGVARAATIAAIFGLCCGAAWLLPLTSRGSPLPRQQKVFLAVWLAPALLFFTLGYLKFINSGYLLVASPPLFVWLGGRLATWYDRPWKTAVLGLAAAAHTAVFLWAPLYCSLRSVRAFEGEMAQVQREIRAVAAPRRTLIVSFDSHFLGYRHAGYYLPEYWTVQYPEVSLPAGRRVFAMRDRDTRLLAEVPPEPFERFVLFPLPRDNESHEYLTKVLERFPAGTLRRVPAGSREFLTGSPDDLYRLFPDTARRSIHAATPPPDGVYSR